METFGSLKGVLEASVGELMRVDGVGQESATLISMVVPMYARYCQSRYMQNEKLTDHDQACAYCMALMNGFRSERLYCICLDRRGKIIARRLIAEGTPGQVSAEPRIIA